jgi:hypothetical protein
MFADAPDKSTMQAPRRSCPTCGSSRVAASSYRYDPRRGVALNPDGKSARTWGLLTWVVGTLLVSGVLPYFSSGPLGIAASIPFWVPVALAVGVMLVMTVAQEWRLTNAARIDSYACQDCGHEWRLRDGRPVRDNVPLPGKRANESGD